MGAIPLIGARRARRVREALPRMLGLALLGALLLDVVSMIGPGVPRAAEMPQPVAAQGSSADALVPTHAFRLPASAAAAATREMPPGPSAAETAAAARAAPNDADLAGTYAEEDAPPLEPEEEGACDDARKVTQGVFHGNEFVFTGPCARRQAQWFRNKQEACEVLNGFDVYIVGQSTERRMYYGLQALAAGNEWIFKNGIPEEEFQHLKDQKGPLRNLERRPIKCFHVTLRFETTFAGITNAIKDFVNRGAKMGRTPVVVFQFGLYGLAAGDFRPEDLASQMDSFLTSAQIGERARANGAILTWRPPVPVEDGHKRFRRYNTANTELAHWRDISNAVARKHGLCIFDPFDAILSGIDSGAIAFETGQEWTPPQFGGIHLKDNGRKLVCQLFLNTIRFCRDELKRDGRMTLD